MEETVKTTKSRKKPTLYTGEKIIFALIAIFVVLAITLATLTIIHKTYYEFFWVNGQSMYPTLNYEAKNKDGKLLGQDAEANIDGQYDVDYGIVDTHEDAINKIKRFDIITGKLKTTKDSPTVIKRVVALPGETFYINNVGKNNPGNGDLYIRNAEGTYDLIAQTFIDSKYIVEGTYDYCGSAASPRTLNSDEYFVLGDNRLGQNSEDSRKDGPMKRANVSGVAVALEGKCKIGLDDKGEYVAKDISYYWPVPLN